MTTFTVCTDVHWSVRSVNGPLACNCWTTISRQSATCLLRKRTFGKSVVVSIAISRLDCIDLISVDSVAKINRLYHRNVSPIYSQPAIVTASDLTALLETSLTVRQSAGHRARETVELLRRETLQSISPANSLDLSPLDYRIWGRRTYRTAYVKCQPGMRTTCGSGVLRHPKPSISGSSAKKSCDRNSPKLFSWLDTPLFIFFGC